MYILESRHFCEEHSDTTLCVSPERVLIQKADEDDVILQEWFIPFLKIQDFETNFKLTKDILYFIKRAQGCIFISKNFFETHEAKIYFDQIDYLCWDTFTMETPTCVLPVPNIQGLESEIVTVCTRENKFCIKDESKRIEYTFNNTKIFQEGTVTIVSHYLKQVFEKHTGKVCKLYIQKDNPLCLEFCDGHRIFIAPTL